MKINLIVSPSNCNSALHPAVASRSISIFWEDLFQVKTLLTRKNDDSFVPDVLRINLNHPQFQIKWNLILTTSITMDMSVRKINIRFRLMENCLWWMQPTRANGNIMLLIVGFSNNDISVIFTCCMDESDEDKNRKRGNIFIQSKFYFIK